MSTLKRVVLTLILMAVFASNSAAQNIISEFGDFTLRSNLPGTYGPERCDDCQTGMQWETSGYDEGVYWKRDDRYSADKPWFVIDKMNFRVAFPNDYDPANADKYPLLVFLHGCEETGRIACGGREVATERIDNNVMQLGWSRAWAGKTHLDAIESGEWPGIAIFPQADYQGWESGWFNQASPSMSMLFELIENFIPEFNVDPHQVIIHGYSNGGKGVWDAINRRPDLFAAALPMSASAPKSFFGQAGHMPLWQFQGEVDTNPMVSGSRDLSVHYAENGGNHRYTEYEGQGHGIWFEPFAYAEPDFFSWMTQQSQLNIHSFFGYTNLFEANGDIKLGIAPGHQDYEWYRNGTQLSGENGHQLVVDQAGDYTVRWQRYDGVWCTSNIFSISDEPINLPPTAEVNDVCTDSESQTLFATSNDPEGEQLTYSWTATAPSGYTATFSNSAIEQPELMLALAAGTTQTGPVEVEVVFEVIDSEGLIATSSAIVTFDLAPIAHAGTNGAVELPNVFVLDGSLSVGESFEWTKMSGPTGDLIVDADAQLTNVSFALSGTYEYMLTVTSICATTESIVTVEVTSGEGDLSPIVDAGTDQCSLDGNFDLNGSAVDPNTNDDFGVTYLWTVTSGDAANVTFSDETDPTTSVMVSEVGDYEFTLTGSDVATAPAGSDAVQVTYQVVPVADAGSNQNITLPSSLTLDGSGSSGNNITYEWTQSDGPNGGATIVSPNSEITNVTIAAVGTYEFTLIVRNADCGEAIDMTTVEVDAFFGNMPPTADAGSDICLGDGELGSLVGSGEDPDNDPLTYLWSVVTGDEALVQFGNDASASTEVSFAEYGTYVLELEVFDVLNQSGNDEVTVIYEPIEANAGGAQVITLPTNSVSLLGIENIGSGAAIESIDWSLVDGDQTAVDILSDATFATDVTFTSAGTFVFEFSLTTACEVSASQVEITVLPDPDGENLPPVVDAGDDQCSNNLSVTLGGSAIDPEDQLAGYFWNKLSGPGDVTYNDGTDPAAIATFSEVGVYVLQLSAVDAMGETGVEQVEITINAEPTAMAGSNQSLMLSAGSATLDGSGSSDAEGSITYSWEKVSGPSTTISNSDQAIASFIFSDAGTYVFELTVSDQTCGEATDQVEVVVVNDTGGTCTEVIYRVNAGGSQVSDSPVNWIADTQNSPSTYFAQGNNNVTGWNYNNQNNATSAPNVIFGTNRRNASWGADVKYEFPVTGTSYKVNLYFSEAPGSSVAAGQRVFDVNIEGATILSDYDIVDAVGDGTDVKTFDVTVTDGDLTIELIRNVNEAIISGIEIISCSGAGGNQSPIADAGNNQTITLPTSSITLDGSGSNDPDGDISTFAWSQVSGPTPGQFQGQSTSMLELSGLGAGTYVFELTVTDDIGADDSDQVTLTVNPDAGGNEAPIADAGSAITITLPTSSVQLLGSNSSDDDGSIVAFNWSQLSGPNNATITDINDADPNVSGLVQGTYQFSLSVTDNQGAMATDQVQVQVISGNTGSCEAVLYRINSGGGVISDWEADTQGNPSMYLNPNSQATTGWNYNNTGNTTDAPNKIFGTYRYEAAWTDEISYSFPVDANDVIEVRLYFAEKASSTTQIGERIIGAKIEGNVVFDDLDIVQEVGSGGLMKSYTLQSNDGVIDIEIFKVLKEPHVNGIEILSCTLPPIPRFQQIEENNDLVVFPNPAEDQLSLLISPVETQSTFKAVVYDQAMKAVSVYRMSLLPGQSEVILDLEKQALLKPGMYIIMTENIGDDKIKSQVSRFIKK